MSHRYIAPFSQRGSSPIDTALAERLLQVALSRGGDYADLFFEYEVSGSYGYEEGMLKSAGRGVSMGLGVRVRKGEATGYERLLHDCMIGDFSLFHRADMVEAAWRIATPILKYWEKTPATDFPNYLPGSWGPEAAEALIQRDGRKWINPAPTP